MRGTLLTTTLLTALALPPAVPAAAQPAAAAQDVPLCPARAGWSSLPLARFRADLSEGLWSGRIHNLVEIAGGGSYRWNGAPVDARLLGRYLEITAMMRPEPVLVLNRAANVDCAAIAEAAELAERRLDCQPNLCILTAGERPPGWPSPPAPPAPPSARP